MKNIAILGSTGSIGLQTMDIVAKNRDFYRVTAASCHGNIDVMERQIREFGIETVAVFDEEKARELGKRVAVDVIPGLEGLIQVAGNEPSDIVVNALVGSIGILPTITAIKEKKAVALANKETLVSAGEIVMSLAEKSGVPILPVDSEHSAILQCVTGENRKRIRKIVITCSGGAFRNTEKEKLYHVSAENALKHPNWSMGSKITVDSATLMNKGFEVIEAKMLFGLDYDDIDVIIHPQSIIHSMVEFDDRSVMAQLSSPDMRLPIQYAFTFPDRLETGVEPLDLAAIGSLEFHTPDMERFPCLGYALEAGRAGGSMPCVLNAVNEVAVKAFLEEKIGFMDIPALIRRKLDDHDSMHNPEIEEILELDRRVKEETARELHMPELCTAQ